MWPHSRIFVLIFQASKTLKRAKGAARESVHSLHKAVMDNSKSSTLKQIQKVKDEAGAGDAGVSSVQVLADMFTTPFGVRT